MRGLALLAIIFLASVTFYHCPMRLLSGVPCPCCGYTTALVSLLSLDIRGAFEAHPLFPLITFDLLYLVFRECFTLRKSFEVALLGGSLAAVVVLWLYRVVFLSLLV